MTWTAASISTPAQDGAHELRLGPLEGPAIKELRSLIHKSCAAVGLTQSSEIDLQLQLFALGDGNAVWWEPNSDNILIMVYHCFKQPKGFSGGGVRLFDSKLQDSLRRAAKPFRDIEIDDNSALFFPGGVVSAGLPVRCQSNASNDRLFVLLGLARQGTTK